MAKKPQLENLPSNTVIHHLFRFGRGEMLNFRCVFQVYRMKFIHSYNFIGLQRAPFMENKVKHSSLWQTFGDVLQQYYAVFHSHELLDIFRNHLKQDLYTLHNNNIYIYKYFYIHAKLKYTYIPTSAICPYLLLLESLQSLLANKPPAYRLGIPNQAVAACNPVTLEIIHRPRWRETPLPIRRISGKWEWYCWWLKSC